MPPKELPRLWTAVTLPWPERMPRRERVAAKGDFGDHPAEHRVAEELEPLIARLASHLRAPAAMSQSAAQEGGVLELVTEVLPQLGEVGLWVRRDDQLPLTRSYT